VAQTLVVTLVVVTTPVAAVQRRETMGRMIMEAITTTKQNPSLPEMAVEGFFN
jgi:hypothetical protein